MNNEYRECQRKNRVLRQSNAMCRPKHFCFLIFIMKSLSELAPVPVCVGTMAAHTFFYMIHKQIHGHLSSNDIRDTTVALNTSLL